MPYRRLKTFPLKTGARVITPQFWDRPPMPNVCAVREGKTPNRKPYATPVKPETTTSVFGLEMEDPQSWVSVKTTAEMRRHQVRDMLSFLTRTSEPMPCRRLYWSVDVIRRIGWISYR